MFGADKTLEYVSACGRKFYISKLPSGIVVSIDLTQDEVIGIFILPWYYSKEEVKSMIEYWDTEVYSQIDWDKVKCDLSYKEEGD